MTSEASRGNYLYDKSIINFKDTADNLYEIKLLQILTPGSTQYEEVMSEYMEDLSRSRKRKRDEELCRFYKTDLGSYRSY